jgi:hypothetical protein
LADGTIIWTLPGGEVYVTTPGSALLFPTLMTPTPTPARHSTTKATETTGDRTVLMPRRKTTRAENRARYIAAERARNERAREARRRHVYAELLGHAPPSDGDDDPPPF